MTWRVEIQEQALADLRRLDPEVRRRILKYFRERLPVYEGLGLEEVSVEPGCCRITWREHRVRGADYPATMCIFDSSLEGAETYHVISDLNQLQQMQIFLSSYCAGLIVFFSHNPFCLGCRQ